jgi:hypothetical protein
MPTLEEILKSDGWSDADLAASATLLQDQRFRASMEKQYGAVAAERDFLTDWRETTANPHIAAVEAREVAARTEAARLAELVKIAKEYGVPGVETPAAPAAAAQSRSPATGEYVDRAYLDNYGRDFAMGQRKAMAQYVDISSEHQRLFGHPVESFESLLSDIDNLPAHERGRLGLKDVWARKYNVEGKRAEIRAAEQAAHDKKIRDEAVRETEMKYVQQRANPLLRTPAPSTQPFIPTRMGEGNKPVQPWEEPKGVMKERRIGSALKSQFESEAVN